MKSLVKKAAAPGLAMEDIAEPTDVPDGHAVVRVLRTGICGTDLHIESWDAWAAATVAPPITPGHEFVGEIVEIRGDGAGFAPGDIASGEGHLVCGECRNCRAGRRHLCVKTVGLGVHRDGAFAEYVVLPTSNLWVHPSGIDLDLAAIFDPFGNAMHTALKYPVAGEDVLITGAGPIGLMAAAIVRHLGARRVVITDVSEPRLEIARSLGVDLAVNVVTDRVVDAQRRLGLREGFDIGLEMSGSPTALPEMIENLTHGGRVAMLGLPTQQIVIDWARVVSRMVTISGVYGRQMYETWHAMSAMLESSGDLRGQLGSIITHRYSLDDWQVAFDTARGSHAGKVVIDWSNAHA